MGMGMGKGNGARWSFTEAYPSSVTGLPTAETQRTSEATAVNETVTSWRQTRLSPGSELEETRCWRPSAHLREYLRRAVSPCCQFTV